MRARTIAMHLARPTRMRPWRRSSLSGRKAHASASMRKGAMIQFMMMLKVSWTKMSRLLKILCSASNRTLQRMGYIMTSSPTAGGKKVSRRYGNRTCKPGPCPFDCAHTATKGSRMQT